MPSSRQRAAPDAKSLSRSATGATSISCSVAICLKSSSSCSCSSSVPTMRGRSGGSGAWAAASSASSVPCSRSSSRSGLRADAGGSRKAVGGVAAQRDEVRHVRGLDAVALAHLLGPDLNVLLALAHFKHSDVLARGAVEVTVARQQAAHGALALARGGRRRTSRRRPPDPRYRARSSRRPQAAMARAVHCAASSGGIGSRCAW